jgi:hypothetical protein
MASNHLDEDVLFYLSTLSHEQQKQLDDFVSISDHAIVPPPVKFAYGNGVGANHYFGRPMSVYEPFVHDTSVLEFIQENEFSSLPPDLVSSSNANIDQSNYPWEAEDAEYIETLNELHDNFVEPQVNFNLQTVAADVHFDPDETHIYATVNKPKKCVENPMTASDRSASDPPREKFPKIMTQSCYGQLNNPADLWNCYEQDLVNSMENIIEDHQALTDSSIIDGVSSMNSSMYEQIPSLTSSSIDMQRSGSQRKIKWWDDLHEHAEESIVDLQEMAAEGEFFIRSFLFFNAAKNATRDATRRFQSYF